MQTTKYAGECIVDFVFIGNNGTAKRRPIDSVQYVSWKRPIPVRLKTKLNHLNDRKKSNSKFLMFNFFFSARLQNLETPASGERIVFGNLPMFHAFGMCVFITTLLGQSAKIVLLPRFVEEDFLRCIEVTAIVDRLQNVQLI